MTFAERFRGHFGMSAKLYWLASLSTLAVALLAVASIHFAWITEDAALQLDQKGFAAVETSARLQALLAQHRQIVESAPAEVDRSRLETSQRDFLAKSAQLSLLIDQLDRGLQSDKIARDLRTQISNRIPELVTAGQRVMFYAYNFAQDNALASAAAYAKTADEVEDEIRQYRVHQVSVANDSVSTLLSSARSLLLWVSISALAALLLIGPVGLTTTRGVLKRLDLITKYMARLAKQPITEPVPSLGDRDEIGDMARAVQVFKENGAELFDRKHQLERVNTQLDLALNNMTHGLAMFDSHRRLIVCNERYARLYGLPADLCKEGTELTAILQYLVDQKRFSETPLETFSPTTATPAGDTFQFTKPFSDGRLVSVSHQGTTDGGWVSIHEDITERQKAAAHIAHMARHDHLTDLPNRVYFREELERNFRGVRNGEGFAILCVDLDRFKAVNDSMGHPVGDKLLKVVASRLINCCKECDFVARLGGDEFAIIQTNLSRPEESSALAIRIIDRLSAAYDVDGQQMDIGASIGLALAPTDGANADQLLKNADLAMYRAKADGRGSFCFFESEMDARIQARRALELELRSALANGQLQLYYQPLVNPKTGQIRCFEALLRWFHPRLGEIPATDFVPLAEESGLIASLGQWVLQTACAEAVKWPKELRVAVNLSSIQFKNMSLVKVILGALATSGLQASRLELEITETLLLEDNAKTLAMLHELRSLGVHIVMDDFGTGFSSLNYLRSFPFDKIKIDKSFIKDLSKDDNSEAIVRTVIRLAQALNIDVVAEGVETKAQLDFVVVEGCTEVQGFYFSPAMPIESFERVLSESDARFELAA
ncbi:MAG: EAL domain-containing protein [Xanthobacteraceae bacterium]